MDKINIYLESLPEWQKANLAIFRQTVHEAAPNVEEDWKWNVPVFLVEGKLQFAMSAFKAHTKYNFIGNGALLNDPDGLFNNGFESRKSRGIDLKQGDSLNIAHLTALIKSSLDMLSS